MKKLLLTCLTLFCVSVLDKCNAEFKVTPSSGGAKVTCSGTFFKANSETQKKSEGPLIPYEDSKSGEYECKEDDKTTKVFIKYRSCDNCIELDVVSITGLIVGNVVATFVIGVSVYILAKHTPSGTATPNKKGSDKQRLVPEEVDFGEHYQPLRPRNGPGDVYDKLRK